MIAKRRIGFVLMILVMGCAQRSPQQRLADFINDPKNKIVRSIQVGDVTIIAKWLPAQYRNGQLAIDNGHSATGNTGTVHNNQPPKDSLLHEDYCYFNVKFEKKAGEKPANDKVLYLDFDMQNDFTLLCAGDSISPVICQKIENGIGGSYEYMLAFNNSNSILDRNDYTLYYKDKVFGVGVVAFVYSQNEIRKYLGVASEGDR